MKEFFLGADETFAVTNLSRITGAGQPHGVQPQLAAVDAIKASAFSTDTQAAFLKAGREEGKALLAVLPGSLR